MPTAPKGHSLFDNTRLNLEDQIALVERILLRDDAATEEFVKEFSKIITDRISLFGDLLDNLGLAPDELSNECLCWIIYGIRGSCDNGKTPPLKSWLNSSNKTNLYGFISVTTRNFCIDSIRRINTKKTEYLDDLSEEDEPRTTSEVNTLNFRLEQDGFRAKLTPQQQKIFRLKFELGLSDKEIAKMMKTSESTLRRWRQDIEEEYRRHCKKQYDL